MSVCLHGTVTRSLLGLPSLSIGGDTDALQFDGANNAADAARWSGDQWDLNFADSPWVHGEHLVSARRQNSDLALVLWIRSATFDGIQTAYEALRDAVAQWSYTLTLSLDTTTYTYACWPGDIALGFTRTHAFSNAAPCTVIVPVMPSF